ncbi:MAG: hypothetical protein F6K47_01100 [Symploca sp. SIO2E6]|nr:hypothetical protein [Symploca sp. SIO2E6]
MKARYRYRTVPRWRKEAEKCSTSETVHLFGAQVPLTLITLEKHRGRREEAGGEGGGRR